MLPHPGRSNPSLVAECFAENRPRLEGTAAAIARTTSTIDLERIIHQTEARK